MRCDCRSVIIERGRCDRCSDPVLLAELLEMYLEGDMTWAKEEHRSAALEVKARLENEHGVCFPIGRNRMAAKDDRGHVVQPDCPRN